MANKKDSPPKKRIFKSLESLADISTAHGIRYVLHSNFSSKERFFWVVMVVCHASFAGFVGFNLWMKFVNAPIHNVIANIHYPLTSLIFPAVTLCPVNRINRTRAIDVLNRHTSTWAINRTINLDPILDALTVMKYPSYYNMERHLKQAEDSWDVFKTLDLTDFFLQTLPECSEIFEECYWEGIEVDCCEVFSLQRTEEGFCYAFNSLTSKEDCQCPFGEDGTDEGNDNSTCTYFHTSSTGSFSGLTAILKREGPLYDATTESIIRGVLVLINSACEYPEAGSGILFETFPGQVLEIEVGFLSFELKLTPIVFEADSTIESISRQERMCLFPEERRLSFHNYYSEPNCLLECRHKFISDSCNCQPPMYFVYQNQVHLLSGWLHLLSGLCGLLPSKVKKSRRSYVDGRRSMSSNSSLKYNSCSFPDLMCISNLSSQGKIRASATGGYCTEEQECPDCTCMPSCHRLQHDFKTRNNILTIFKGKERQGILEIHYSNLGAIKYQTQLTFSVEELLIAIGGTGSILMGASMISGTEIVYYSVRKIYNLITNISRKYRTKNIPPSASFAN